MIDTGIFINKNNNFVFVYPNKIEFYSDVDSSWITVFGEDVMFNLLLKVNEWEFFGVL